MQPKLFCIGFTTDNSRRERERESVHKKERESFLADVIIISERR